MELGGKGNALRDAIAKPVERAQHAARFDVALCRRLVKKIRRRRLVHVHASTPTEELRKVELRGSEALVGSEAIPVRGLGHIDRRALAVFIHCAEVNLRASVAKLPSRLRAQICFSS